MTNEKNVIMIDEACFYLKESGVAVFLNNLAVLAESAVYDGRNTLVLTSGDGKNYAVQNIVPEVRKVLAEADNLMVILGNGEEISDAYELKLQHNDNLGFEDTFFENASKFYEDMVKLVEEAN